MMLNIRQLMVVKCILIAVVLIAFPRIVLAQDQSVLVTKDMIENDVIQLGQMDGWVYNKEEEKRSEDKERASERARHARNMEKARGSAKADMYGTHPKGCKSVCVSKEKRESWVTILATTRTTRQRMMKKNGRTKRQEARRKSKTGLNKRRNREWSARNKVKSAPDKMHKQSGEISGL
jgi:hypothetical protein